MESLTSWAIPIWYVDSYSTKGSIVVSITQTNRKMEWVEFEKYLIAVAFYLEKEWGYSQRIAEYIVNKEIIYVRSSYEEDNNNVQRIVNALHGMYL